jgi:PadR family transcriptional regulator PadR
MQDTDSITSWKSQLRKGAAELAVLALLRDREAYGLEILQALTTTGQLGVREGSIYPLLKRLEKGGKIEARWSEAPDGGAPRKYYSLSKPGRSSLAEMEAAWTAFRDELTAILKGDRHV